MTSASLPHIEDIVRPFQFENVLPAFTGFDHPEVEGVIQMKFGGSGGRTTSISQEGSTTGPTGGNTDKFKETDRTSTKTRVENEDDPDQFVEFCRADSVTLKPQKKDPSKQPRTSSYDTSGGYHDASGAGGIEQKQNNRQYDFKYPTDKQCKAKDAPKKGC